MYKRYYEVMKGAIIMSNLDEFFEELRPDELD